MTKSNQHIGVITFPISEAGVIPLRNLIEILGSLCNELHLVTGGAGYKGLAKDHALNIYAVGHKASSHQVFRVINYVWTQLRILEKLMRLRNKVDIWIFFIGGEGLILPIAGVKLLRKKLVITSAGSGLKVSRVERDRLAGFLGLLQNVTYSLSDRIVVYSARLIREWGLQRYSHKISVAYEHFLNLEKFNVRTTNAERGCVVGYIGTLTKAKGIPNLLEAIPKILAGGDKIEFLFGGGGELRGMVEQYLEDTSLKGKGKFVGWIPHDELPQYLNELKLLVLPSYTEGLPNIVLEAMACGTPVLATPVGAIPDVIKDGDTGFILEDNSPEAIARGIIKALNHPNFEQITQNACALVERVFTFEKAVERYKKILEEL